MSAPISITWTALRDGNACARGIRARFPALRASGITIPRAYSTSSVDLLTLVRVLGIEAALNAASYARVEDPRLRLFAADCAERALLRERTAGREPDSRSWAAVEVARRYARGEATRDDLAAAWAAGMDAAKAAERAWQTHRLTLYLTDADLPPVDLEPA